MQIITEDDLRALCRRKPYSGAKEHVERWIARTRVSSWRSFVDVKGTFRTADYVEGKVIFDIQGNRYRLVTAINYGLQTVRVTWFGTHKEYDRRPWQ